MTGLILWLARNIVITLVTWLANVFVYVIGEWVLKSGKLKLVWLMGLLIALSVYLLEDVFRVGKTGFHWIIHKIWSLWGDACQALIDLLPEETQPDIGDLETYINAANLWVPLDLAVTLTSAYITFALLWGSYFMLKRHIPTLGK